MAGACVVLWADDSINELGASMISTKDLVMTAAVVTRTLENPCSFFSTAISIGNSWALSSHFANAADVAGMATDDIHKQVRPLHLASGLHGRQSHNLDLGSKAA